MTGQLQELARKKEPTPAVPEEDIVLPVRPHRPGTGTVAETALLTEMKASCPKVTDPNTWRENQTYRHGWSLFEAGFYWEAHEVWEPVWLACRPNSLERLFLKAAIQMSNARLKQAMGNRKAARRLFDEVDGLVGELKTALGGDDQSYMGADFKVFARPGSETL